MASFFFNSKTEKIADSYEMQRPGTWIWANSRRQWRTGEPGVLPFMGSQSWTWCNDWTTMKPAAFFFHSLSIPERLLFSSILTSFQSSLSCSFLSWFIFHSLPTSSITVGDTHWKTGRQDTEVNDCGFSNTNVSLRHAMRVWVHILASAVLSQCTWSTVDSELELSSWWLSQ